MRVVLDTNVVVSGLLQALGPSGQIVRLVAEGELQVCYDVRILAEYREVLLRPKFRFEPGRVEAFLFPSTFLELTGAALHAWMQRHSPFRTSEGALLGENVSRGRPVQRG